MDDVDETSSSSLASIKTHILQTKIPPETVSALVNDAENAGMQLVSALDDAEVIITEIHMRKRLERHTNWDIAKTKSFVTPAWLTSSIAAGRPLPCGDFAAIRDLKEETKRNCPDSPDCKGCSRCGDDNRSGNRSQRLLSPPPTPPPQPLHSPATGVSLLVYAEPWDIGGARPKFDHSSRYACARLHPLVCVNQGLVDELRIMKKARELEGEARSALSYARAVGVIKAFPSKITSPRQVEHLPYIGPKIGQMISDYLSTGHVPEAQTLVTSPRFIALQELASVHGVGSTTARRLYDLGLRTIEDMRNYYGVSIETDEDEEGIDDELQSTIEESETGIKAALRVYDEINTPIPRVEVEEIARSIYAELCVVQEGCVYTIVGGYRRGKQFSNDVDIVFTHPTPGVDRGLCKRLVQRLRGRGMVSQVMHLSSFRAPHSIRKANWDTLEKALTVFRLPPESTFYSDGDMQLDSVGESVDGSDGRRHRLHRRVDLIFAPVEVYWCAVTGWTGSTMFERDLRLWTKDKRGWKFDSSGMVQLTNTEPVLATSEQHIFELCGLEWIDPTMRNAD